MEKCDSAIGWDGETIMERTIQVLVADDEPTVRLAISRILRGSTFQVSESGSRLSFAISEAETGEDALRMLNGKSNDRTPIDILLLDYKLPGMDGLEVLSRIQESGAGLLTVMISGYASNETAKTATQRGAFDFLSKPFTPDELKKTLRKACVKLLSR